MIWTQTLVQFFKQCSVTVRRTMQRDEVHLERKPPVSPNLTQWRTQRKDWSQYSFTLSAWRCYEQQNNPQITLNSHPAESSPEWMRIDCMNIPAWQVSTSALQQLLGKVSLVLILGDLGVRSAFSVNSNIWTSVFLKPSTLGQGLGTLDPERICSISFQRQKFWHLHSANFTHHLAAYRTWAPARKTL